MANVVEIVLKTRDQTGGALRGVNSALGRMASLAGTALVGGFAAATAALGAFAVQGIRNGNELEAQLSAISAILGATNVETQALKDVIQDLAINPDLKVNTQEAAAAVEMLARNGLQADQIIGGAAESVVMLANATGANFSTAADLATDVMAQFNIEATNMESAIDGITAVVNNSKFSIDDAALAFAQAGGVAGTVGVSFDDFATSIAAIAPLFNSGSDAGTSFKVFLQRLVPNTNTAIDAMQRLGLTRTNLEQMGDLFTKFGVEFNALEPDMDALREATGLTADQFQKMLIQTNAMTSKFFDAEGNMLSMSTIASELNVALADLSDAQRVQALQTIFGTDAMRAAAGLMESGAASTLTAAEMAETLGISMEEATAAIEDGTMAFEVLQEQMGNTSAAENAARRMDNLKGDIEIFKGVVENLGIQFRDVLGPELRELTQWATGWVSSNGPALINGFKDLAEGIKGFIAGFKEEGLLIGLENLFDSMNVPPEVQEKIMNLADAFLKMFNFIAANGSTILSVLAGLAAGFAALTIINTVAGAIIGLVTAWGAVSAAFAGGATIIGGIVAVLGGPVTVAIGLVVGAIALLTAAWTGNWFNIQERTAAAIQFIQDHFNNIKTYVETVFIPNLLFMRDQWVNMWGAIRTRTQEVIDNLRQKYDQLKDKWDEIWTTISLVQKNATTVITTLFAEIGRWINDNIIPWVNVLASAWMRGFNIIKTVVLGAWNFIKPIFIQVVTWLAEKIVTALVTLQGMYNTAFTAIQNAISTAWDFALGIFTTMVNWYKTIIPNALATMADRFAAEFLVMKLAVEGLKFFVDQLWDAVQGFWNWISSHKFEFKIKIPDIPDWAVPGSPIPLHTAWKDFDRDLKNMSFTPRLGAGVNQMQNAAGIDNSRSSTVTQIFNLQKVDAQTESLVQRRFATGGV